jgi:hypothetical protein
MDEKIAFCFLTYQDIVTINVWNNFFKNIDTNKYSVWIHPKNNIDISKYIFPVNIIKNKIITKSKTDISIVLATLQLLRESYSDEITHYIFLSQSCIPLYNFDILYKIISQTDKSILSYIQNNKKERYYQLVGNNIQNFITYQQFVKQQPNMILVKDDVELIIKKDYTPFFYKMECPDEHYFINVLLYIFKKQIIKQQTHFCNHDLHKTQALEFLNINKIFINDIRSKGFLFMRKVGTRSYIDIECLLSI